MKVDIFTQIGRLVLRPWKESITPRLRKAGLSEIPFHAAGLILFSLLFIAAIGYIYISIAMYKTLGLLLIIILAPIVLSLIFLLVSLTGLFLLSTYLEIAAYNRLQGIEQTLPLFLRELSTNLKAGREFVDALENSTEEDMGALHEDICELVVQIRSGKMIEKVIEEYTKKYDSPIVEETFDIILDAYKGGSSLADIIDKIAENLEVIFYLRKEAVASVSSYVIFMSIVSLVIAPLLFALSYNLLSLIHSLLAKVYSSGTNYLPANIGSIDINFDDFRLFSQIAIVIIAGSSAGVIGIIKKGNLKGSLAIIAGFVVTGLLSHWIFLIVLTWLFGNLYNLG
jgi:pilus assembly protein TadC